MLGPAWSFLWAHTPPAAFPPCWLPCLGTRKLGGLRVYLGSSPLGSMPPLYRWDHEAQREQHARLAGRESSQGPRGDCSPCPFCRPKLCQGRGCPAMLERGMNVAIPCYLTLGEGLPSAGGPGCSKPCLSLSPWLPLAESTASLASLDRGSPGGTEAIAASHHLKGEATCAPCRPLSATL